METFVRHDELGPVQWFAVLGNRDQDILIGELRRNFTAGNWGLVPVGIYPEYGKRQQVFFLVPRGQRAGGNQLRERHGYLGVVFGSFVVLELNFNGVLEHLVKLADGDLGRLLDRTRNQYCSLRRDEPCGAWGCCRSGSRCTGRRPTPQHRGKRQDHHHCQGNPPSIRYCPRSRHGLQRILRRCAPSEQCRRPERQRRSDDSADPLPAGDNHSCGPSACAGLSTRLCADHRGLVGSDVPHTRDFPADDRRAAVIWLWSAFRAAT